MDAHDHLQIVPSWSQRRMLPGFAGLVTCLWTTIAHACPGCVAAKNEENQIAFLVTTALLTFAPLLMIGGLVWWLRRHERGDEFANQRPEHPDPATESGAAGLITLIAAGLAAGLRWLRRDGSRLVPRSNRERGPA
ncbi:MAG: hypothetical protein B7733_08410 [Myxococcales bacterium FL481]|nr:MAG: hypothetical protein B7733_08410 [Myxococcales bacterium FL481]